MGSGTAHRAFATTHAMFDSFKETLSSVDRTFFREYNTYLNPEKGSLVALLRSISPAHPRPILDDLRIRAGINFALQHWLNFLLLI
jgi:hypothetical protein